jgi:apolipoprotein N-acyltransferase
MHLLLRLVLCLVASALLALAGPPFGAWPLVFVAFVPLLAALDGLSPRAALLLGGLFGLSGALARFGWMDGVFLHFVDAQRGVAALLTGLLFAIDGVRYAGLGLALALAARAGAGVAASFPLALLGVEALFASLQPWASGYCLVGAPWLAQAADLGGVPLLSCAIALTNAFVFLAGRGGEKRWRHALLAALVPGLLAAHGAWMEHVLPALQQDAGTLHVGIVQANMRAGAGAGPALEAYENASVAFAREQQVDLLVWPEGAVEYALDPARLDDAFRSYVRLAERMAGKGPALLTGTTIQRRMLGPAENSAILVDADRRVLGTYGKVHPMPFGEFVPGARYLPWLRDYLPNAGNVATAQRAGFVELGGHRIQPRICYEEVLPAETREAVLANAPELFVDLADDAWFGATPAAEFHLAMARLRAIEHRRYVVRAANDGLSALIDPLGRLAGVAPLRAPAVLHGEVRWLSAITPFTRLGEFPAWALALCVALAAARSAQERKSWALNPKRLSQR